MNEPELRQLLQQHNLGRVIDGIMQHARPAIRAHTRPMDDAAIPPGASKMGGLPDLPPDFAYPRWHEPMRFIGQFNLASTYKFDREKLLPDRGLLSFFYETDGEPLYSDKLAGIDIEALQQLPREERRKSWQVLYFPDDPTKFTRSKPTEELAEDAIFPACALRFSNALTLPYADAPEFAPLKLTCEERSALIGIEQDVNEGDFGDHQLLGHPYIFECSTMLEAGDRMDEWRAAAPADRLAIEADVNQRWLLLLQVGGSEDLAMSWAGGGVLHFCIEREKLQARDFGQVWLNLDFL
jgi:uncharacterized protein YwqG